MSAPAWKGGTCRVPMWRMGSPAGFCDRPAFGPQLPKALTRWRFGNDGRPYCFGPCCPAHDGPREGDPIVFTDGNTREGYSMYCAVMPDFENLQESPAGFSGNPIEAVKLLRAEIAKLPAPPAPQVAE
jgi:hypothetical protein